jgi:biopolymer transport protein ExbD
MKRYSQRDGMSTLTEINVTPLLDLAFVLLIIFIITTPLLENSVDLIVPTSSADRKPTDPAANIVLEVNAQREFLIDGLLLPPGGLRAELQRLAASRPTAGVVVRTHRDLPVQVLVDIMDELKAARITKVGVLTQPPEALSP